MRWVLAAGCLSMVASLCGSLRGSPLVDLELDAPAPCPDHDAIEALLAQRVRRLPALPLRIAARFEPIGTRWVLYATFEGGQRAVSGDSCEAVAEALVTMMALAIDPSGGVESAPQEVAAPTVSSQPNNEPPAPVQRESPRSPTHEPSAIEHAATPAPNRSVSNAFGTSLLMLTETGLLPAWSLGPSLAAHYGAPSSWAEISASALYPRFAPVTGQPSKGGRLGWFAAQLAGCRTPGESWPVAGCLGFEIGDLLGYGVNTEHRNAGHALWTALSGGVAYRGRVHGDLGLELRLNAAVPFTRPDFGISGYGKIFHPDQISLRFALGLSWR